MATILAHSDWLDGLALFTSLVAIVVAVLGTRIAQLSFNLNADPHVIVYADADNDRKEIILLIVENIGHNVALNVRFKSSRPIPFGIYNKHIGTPGEGKTVADEAVALANGIPSLAPKSKRVFNWGQYEALQTVLGDEVIKIDLRYESDRPGTNERVSHDDESLIEISSFAFTDASEQSLRKVGRMLERINKTLESASRQLHKK